MRSMNAAANASQLRKFGLLVGAIFCGIGLWPAVVRGGGPRSWALGLGALLIVAGLIAPRSLGPAHRLWMAAGEVLGWINTRIILGVVFYCIITPMGLVRRLVHRDPLGRASDPSAESYRVPKAPRPGSHMTRQF